MKKIIHCLVIILCTLVAHSQDNPGKRKGLWGDTWHFSPGLTLSGTNAGDFFAQPEFTVGRIKHKQYGANQRHGPEVYTAYGAGYSFYFDDGMNNLAHLYVDRAHILSFGFGLTVRLEYMYNINANAHFLRPGLGVTIPNLELLFVTNIRLGNDEAFGHAAGLGMRFYIFKGKRYMKED